MIAWAAGDGAAVTLRFLVYLDLLLLAGLLLCARRVVPADLSGHTIASLAAVGAVLTVAQFLSHALAMTGGDLAVLDVEMLRYLALETSMGLSNIARLLLLVATAVLAINVSGVAFVTPFAIAALATLAWSGHAGTSEGGIGALHRVSDIVHLIAASAWLGTLALLLLALARSNAASSDLIAALRRFAITGTLIVAALIVTGIVNLWAIVGFDALPTLTETGYSRTLGLKLTLFAAMLGFASYNRWRLTPQLQRGGHDGPRSLPTSVAFETTLAVGVILTVAILGTLSPNG